ncbi:MAG: hypothetical protein WBB45_04530 [Cyclobacteriaceae bacterium]
MTACYPNGVHYEESIAVRDAKTLNNKHMNPPLPSGDHRLRYAVDPNGIDYLHF